LKARLQSTYFHVSSHLHDQTIMLMFQVTYNVALGVCIKAMEGRMALNLFTEMKATGLTPGKIAYECTCDALEVN